MSNEPTLTAASKEVIAHLSMIQGVITRMAENSRSCKVWCVTLVAGTLVLVARTGESHHALIALMPTLLFFVLDSYYLALERAFIEAQNAFVAKLHKGDLSLTEVYKVEATGMGWRLVGRRLSGSVSELLFYVPVTATVLVSWVWVL